MPQVTSQEYQSHPDSTRLHEKSNRWRTGQKHEINILRFRLDLDWLPSLIVSPSECVIMMDWWSVVCNFWATRVAPPLQDIAGSNGNSTHQWLCSSPSPLFSLQYPNSRATPSPLSWLWSHPWSSRTLTLQRRQTAHHRHRCSKLKLKIDSLASLAKPIRNVFLFCRRPSGSPTATEKGLGITWDWGEDGGCRKRVRPLFHDIFSFYFIMFLQLII